MGDRLRVAIGYRLGQLGQPLSRVPASAGVKAGYVTSVEWQVTPCDPIAYGT